MAVVGTTYSYPDARGDLGTLGGRSGGIVIAWVTLL